MNNEETKKRELTWETARVSHEFRIEERRYQEGYFIHVSRDAIHDRYQSGDPILILDDDGIYYAIFPYLSFTKVSEFKTVAYIMQTCDVSPFGGFINIPEINEYLEILELSDQKDPWDNIKPGDFVKYDPREGLDDNTVNFFDSMFERGKLYKVESHEMMLSPITGLFPRDCISIHGPKGQVVFNLENEGSVFSARKIFTIPRFDEIVFTDEMILQSKDLNAIAHHIKSICKMDMDQYQESGLWEDVVKKCITINKFDSQTKMRVMEILQVGFYDIADICETWDETADDTMFMDKEVIMLYLKDKYDGVSVNVLWEFISYAILHNIK